MKKRTLLFIPLAFILLISLANAAVIDIKKDVNTSVLIAGTSNPAIITLYIKNNGVSANFEIYSLAGITITPKQVYLPKGETTTVTIEAEPNRYVRNNLRGSLIFEYEIYSPSNGITKDSLLFKIIDLRELVEIKSLPIIPGDEIARFSIQNKENAKFENVKIHFKSPFFNAEQTISLEPYTVTNISIPIDVEKIKKVVAGTYESDVDLTYKEAKDHTTTDVKYLERSGLSVYERSDGLIIRKTMSEKRNEGNVPVTANITQKKNLLTRLVTTFSTSPTSTTRNGLFVNYNWEKTLAPGEALSITTTTNYTLPFIIVIIIIGLVIGVKYYAMTPVSITKRVSFVRTKGGEFALRVKLTVKARQTVDNLVLTDRIPHAMNIYEQFTVKPHLIDSASRRIVWNISRLHAGEERTFNYVIYSKMSVVGSFTLPIAHASFVRNGQKNQVNSNQTTFVADTSSEEN